MVSGPIWEKGNPGEALQEWALRARGVMITKVVAVG